MVNDDTIKLLRESNAGVKMGVDSISDILDNVRSESLKKLLETNKEEHQRIGSEIHHLLNMYEEYGKEPNPMAKGMSWIKTNLMLSVKDSDQTVADLITDGCNMGVKSLNKYLNKYPNANEKSKQLTLELIDLEQQLTIDIRKYL